MCKSENRSMTGHKVSKTTKRIGNKIWYTVSSFRLWTLTTKLFLYNLSGEWSWPPKSRFLQNFTEFFIQQLFVGSYHGYPFQVEGDSFQCNSSGDGGWVHRPSGGCIGGVSPSYIFIWRYLNRQICTSIWRAISIL